MSLLRTWRVVSTMTRLKGFATAAAFRQARSRLQHQRRRAARTGASQSTSAACSRAHGRSSFRATTPTSRRVDSGCSRKRMGMRRGSASATTCVRRMQPTPGSASCTMRLARSLRRGDTTRSSTWSLLRLVTATANVPRSLLLAGVFLICLVLFSHPHLDVYGLV